MEEYNELHKPSLQEVVNTVISSNHNTGVSKLSSFVFQYNMTWDLREQDSFTRMWALLSMR